MLKRLKALGTLMGIFSLIGAGGVLMVAIVLISMAAASPYRSRPSMRPSASPTRGVSDVSRAKGL